MPAKLDKHEPPPQEWIDKALASERPIPDETAGAYCPEFYHGNTTGAEMGFASQDRRRQWLESNEAEQRLQDCIDKILVPCEKPALADTSSASNVVSVADSAEDQMHHHRAI